MRAAIILRRLLKDTWDFVLVHLVGMSLGRRIFKGIGEYAKLDASLEEYPTGLCSFSSLEIQGPRSSSIRFNCYWQLIIKLTLYVAERHNKVNDLAANYLFLKQSKSAISNKVKPNGLINRIYRSALSLCRDKLSTIYHPSFCKFENN